MTIISRDQLQNCINSLAETGQKLVEQNSGIPYVTFKNQVEKGAEFYSQEKQRDQNRIAQEKIKFFLKLNSFFQDGIHELILNKLLNIYAEQDITCLDCNNIKVSIIGAGPAGLLSAYILARQGAEVTLYEARSVINFTLRPQNISFREADVHLKCLLDKNLYQAFFQRGAALDDEGKLRITIGTFQEVLLEGVENLNVKIHYNSAVTLKDVEKFRDTDVILIAAGAHAYQRLQLQDYFEQEVFEQYAAKGKTALFIGPSIETPGYTGKQREGYDWWRENKSIFSGKALSQDIERVIKISSKIKTNPDLVSQLEKLKSHSNVEYTFTFGNNTDHFLQTLNTQLEPILQSEYVVTPTILRNPVTEYQNKPLIAIGDSNGSPHPLAAIGTLKFIKDAKELTKFISVYGQLKALNSAKKFPEDFINDLMKDVKYFYALTAMENIKIVFYENILSSIFSKLNLLPFITKPGYQTI